MYYSFHVVKTKYEQKSPKIVTSVFLSNILPVSKEWKRLGVGNIRESRKYEQDCIVCAKVPYPWFTSSAFSSAPLVAFLVEARANELGETRKGLIRSRKPTVKQNIDFFIVMKMLLSHWSDEKIETDGHNYYHSRAAVQKSLILRFLFQVARRLMHRPMLIYRIPGLVIIDGIPVSDDERTKADLYFMEQQVQW